ncbi:putative hydroxypyruvate reductase [archaeon BMS3Bbin15]|nr:putative hydroxypyruvate reductase [archaeon BMS3Bbin15]
MQWIRNYNDVLDNSANPAIRKAREVAMKLLNVGIGAVDPFELTKAFFKKASDLNFNNFSVIRVIGFGKASFDMARAVEEIIDVEEGVIVVPEGAGRKSGLRKIRILEGGHPIPDDGSVAASSAALKIAERSGEKDFVVVLVSGGGSALFARPAEGITLKEKQEVTQLLLKSGCTIDEFNSVRKHISDVKGGQLAKACYPAHVLALIISDVVGDPMETVASGPTLPDPTTFQDAGYVFDKYGLWERAPESVCRRIKKGMAGKIEETPKSLDSSLVRNVLIGNNSLALTAMEKAARREYNTLILTGQLEGEGREAGKVLAGIAKEVLRSSNPVKRPCVLILGGETTVTVVGNGKGGRNQELVLGAALSLQKRDVVIASLGTDGIDGSTDAAGGIADGFTVERGNKEGLDVVEYLSKNDSNTFLSAIHDALITGRTNTNVGDIIVIVVI